MRTLLAMSALVSGVVLAALPAATTAPMTLRVSLVNTMFRQETEKSIQAQAGPFKSLMQEQAGVLGDVVVGGSPEDVATQLKMGKVDLGVFYGHEFAWERQKNADMKPLMVAVNQQPFARAVLVVSAENKGDIASLRGKTVAMPKLMREHCRLFLDRRCVPEGMTTDKFFGKTTSPRTSEDALDDVAENAAQATVVDDVELEAYRKRYPKSVARLRVMKESEKFPPPVVAYQAGKEDEQLMNKLRTGMINAKSMERGRNLLELCRITGFEAVPADYEKMLTDILKAYPPPK